MLPNQFCTWTSCTAAAPRPHPIDGADHPSPRKAHTPTASVRPHPRQRAQQAELLWPFGRFQVGAGPGCAGPLDGADQLERCGGVRPLRREAVWQRRLSPTERPSTPVNAENRCFPCCRLAHPAWVAAGRADGCRPQGSASPAHPPFGANSAGAARGERCRTASGPHPELNDDSRYGRDGVKRQPSVSVQASRDLSTPCNPVTRSAPCVSRW